MRDQEGWQHLLTSSGKKSETRPIRFVGTAGWSIPGGEAKRFSGPGSHLQRYASRLGAVEINSSFYRPHRRVTYERWAATVPSAFRFAVKVPKIMTHEQKLIGCHAAMDGFMGQIGGLGDKLGALLVQLPPSLVFEATIAASFFMELCSRTDAPVACEPRHESWFTPEADALLAASNIARVAADPPRAPSGGQPGGWDGLIYIRLHGTPTIYRSDYSAETLAVIRSRLDDWHARGVPAWCIFDNTAAGHALGNACTIAGL